MSMKEGTKKYDARAHASHPNDAGTTAVTLAEIVGIVHIAVTVDKTCISEALPDIQKILDHPQMSTDVMKSMLYMVSECGVEETRPLLESIKQNERVMGFVTALSNWVSGPEDSKDHDKRAFPVSTVARLIIDERELHRTTAEGNRRILARVVDYDTQILHKLKR